MFKGVFSISCLLLMALSISCSDSGGGGGQVSRKIICDNGGAKDIGIFGGKVLSAESEAGRGIVLIVNGDYMCSGSLIDRNIVLTAAHCVPDDESTSPVSVIFSGDPVCQVKGDGRGALKPVSKIIRNVLFKTAGHDSQFDLALIRLSAPAPAGYQPLKLISHPVNLDSNSPVYISGFGKSSADYNDEDSSNPILKVAHVQPLQDSDDPSKITRSNEAKVLYLDQRYGQGACAGDSGGPTFIKESSGLSILGVNSAVDTLQKDDFKNQSEVTCRKGLRIVSVFAQQDWISASYQKLINEDSLGNQFK